MAAWSCIWMEKLWSQFQGQSFQTKDMSCQVCYHHGEWMFCLKSTFVLGIWLWPDSEVESASETYDPRLPGIVYHERWTQTWTFRTQEAAEELSFHTGWASVISWACADTAAGLKSQFVQAAYVEGFLQPQQQFGLDH